MPRKLFGHGGHEVGALQQVPGADEMWHRQTDLSLHTRTLDAGVDQAVTRPRRHLHQVLGLQLEQHLGDEHAAGGDHARPCFRHRRGDGVHREFGGVWGGVELKVFRT